MGFVEGTLKVDGKEVSLKLDSFRDHSFGKTLIKFVKINR